MTGRIGGSVVLLAAMAVVYLVTVWTTAGQRVDQRIYESMYGADTWRDLLHRVGFQRVTDPRLWLLAAVAVIVLGLLARRRGSIIALLVLPALGVVVARMLRTEILPRPELMDIARAAFNTFPSGHTAAAAGCVAAAIRAAPRVVAPVIAVVGAMWTTVVGQGLMEVGAHRPSDIVGSLLMVGAAMLLVPDSTRSGVRPPIAALTGVLAAVGPLVWAVYTGHLVLAAIGVVAAGVFALLTAGIGSRARRATPLTGTSVPQPRWVADR
ncbi:phosphatase PAP2 family protein [Williamsia sp. MIQD14]|uniref:phosphatase PAP2 family protein n=1 Tax=Williamsia sp. MIQD14 TaxID=3425703 RepID=UPI003DA157DD